MTEKKGTEHGCSETYHRWTLWQNRKLFTEAIRLVLLELLKTRIYEFAGNLKLQKGGGPMRMELTAVAVQVFLVWWDKQLKQRLQPINFLMRIHQRYVDDTNIVAKQIPIGQRCNGEELVVNDAKGEGVPPDKRTMQI